MNASDWDKRYAGTDLVWSANANQFVATEVAALETAATTPKQRRAIDLACGEGRNAIWLAERGWETTGVDFSAVALEKAGKLAASRNVTVDWLHRDLAEFAPPAGEFDLVILAYLHVPWPQIAAVLAAAAAALAPNGVVLVVGHDNTNIADGYGGPQAPEVLYGPEEVAAEFACAGLNVERAERVFRDVNTADGPRRAIDNLIRARQNS